MHKHPINLAIVACFGSLALIAPAHAASMDELQAEIAAQKVRLEKLEEILKATAATAASATKKAEQASKEVAASTKGKGLSMPAGLSIYGIADAGIEVGNYGRGSKTRVQSGLGSVRPAGSASRASAASATTSAPTSSSKPAFPSTTARTPVTRATSATLVRAHHRRPRSTAPASPSSRATPSSA